MGRFLNRHHSDSFLLLLLLWGVLLCSTETVTREADDAVAAATPGDGATTEEDALLTRRQDNTDGVIVSGDAEFEARRPHGLLAALFGYPGEFEQAEPPSSAYSGVAAAEDGDNKHKGSKGRGGTSPPRFKASQHRNNVTQRTADTTSTAAATTTTTTTVKSLASESENATATTSHDNDEPAATNSTTINGHHDGNHSDGNVTIGQQQVDGGSNNGTVLEGSPGNKREALLPSEKQHGANGVMPRNLQQQARPHFPGQPLPAGYILWHPVPAPFLHGLNSDDHSNTSPLATLSSENREMAVRPFQGHIIPHRPFLIEPNFREGIPLFSPGPFPITQFSTPQVLAVPPAQRQRGSDEDNDDRQREEKDDERGRKNRGRKKKGGKKNRQKDEDQMSPLAGGPHNQHSPPLRLMLPPLPPNGFPDSPFMHGPPPSPPHFERDHQQQQREPMPNRRPPVPPALQEQQFNRDFPPPMRHHQQGVPTPHFEPDHRPRNMPNGHNQRGPPPNMPFDNQPFLGHGFRRPSPSPSAHPAKFEIEHQKRLQDQQDQEQQQLFHHGFHALPPPQQNDNNNNEIFPRPGFHRAPPPPMLPDFRPQPSMVPPMPPSHHHFPRFHPSSPPPQHLDGNPASAPHGTWHPSPPQLPAFRATASPVARPPPPVVVTAASQPQFSRAPPTTPSPVHSFSPPSPFGPFPRPDGLFGRFDSSAPPPPGPPPPAPHPGVMGTDRHHQSNRPTQQQQQRQEDDDDDNNLIYSRDFKQSAAESNVVLPSSSGQLTPSSVRAASSTITRPTTTSPPVSTFGMPSSLLRDAQQRFPATPSASSPPVTHRPLRPTVHIEASASSDQVTQPYDLSTLDPHPHKASPAASHRLPKTHPNLPDYNPTSSAVHTFKQHEPQEDRSIRVDATPYQFPPFHQTGHKGFPSSVTAPNYVSSSETSFHLSTPAPPRQQHSTKSNRHASTTSQTVPALPSAHAIASSSWAPPHHHHHKESDTEGGHRTDDLSSSSISYTPSDIDEREGSSSPTTSTTPPAAQGQVGSPYKPGTSRILLEMDKWSFGKREKEVPRPAME